MKRPASRQQSAVNSSSVVSRLIHVAQQPLLAVTLLALSIQIVSSSQQASGALFTNAQYSSTGASCDSSRLIRCQQDVLRDMQTVSGAQLNVGQYPINSGPPYSPKALALQHQQRQQQQLLANPSTCRLVRSNLDCLLSTTPACYELGIQTAQNTDIILRAKRFLEHNACNEPDTTWQGTFCYRSSEVRSCEERYGFTSFNAAAGSQLANNNVSACLAYQAFKYCVENHLRLNCKVHEMDMANEYLIDRANDLAWRCPANYSSSNPYQLTNSAILSPSVSTYNNFGVYDQQRPVPTYVGSNTQGVSLFGTNRDQAWERFRSPLEDTRFGISRYPPVGSDSLVFDRIVSGNGFEPETSDCPVKAAPYARECEDSLLEQQRLARDSRDGNELQRRICCSLFQYRDCISRVVLDRCSDSTPTAVELLMGVRRREMTISCRGFNRDICSGSLKLLNTPMLLLASLLASLVALRRSILSI